MLTLKAAPWQAAQFPEGSGDPSALGAKMDHTRIQTRCFLYALKSRWSFHTFPVKVTDLNRSIFCDLRQMKQTATKASVPAGQGSVRPVLVREASKYYDRIVFVSHALRRYYPSSTGMTLLPCWYTINPILPINITNVSPYAQNVVRVIAYVSQHGISNAATTTNLARQRPTKRRDDTLLLYDVVRWLCT